MPVLSVIMGVYNCPSQKMLVRAIDSVLAQTFSDFEFIICDDGSENDTLKWLYEKAAEDERIVVIEGGENRGLAIALNMCLERAKGSLIARQDADDYSDHARFRIQVDFLREHKNVSFVGTDCFVYDKNGLYGEWHRPEFPSKHDFLFNSPFIHGTVMFRREVFDRCGGYEIIGRCHKYEDYDLFMRAYAEGFQGANINKLLYTFYSEEKKNFVSRSMRLDEYRVRRKGFKQLGFGINHMHYTWKPLILMLVPNKLLNWMKDYKKNSLMHKQSLSLKMYKVLVNRNSYIKFNYERYVNSNRAKHNKAPFISWVYLVKLNCDSILFKKNAREQTPVKSLINKESAMYMTAESIADKLCESEVVSFDVFDTLIFRPFAVPTDLFYCVGEKLDYPDFRTIRIEAERSARHKKCESVTLKDIYDFLSERTGIESELGQKTEMETEMDLCTANPFMKKVWKIVQERGKRIILTSDMYLPSEFVGQLLESKGFTGFEKVFISCECRCGKHEGSIYEYIKKEMKTDSISHIGDNYGSDVKNALNHGINAIEYKNVNCSGNVFRPKDMSPVIGSAYSGIVNRRLYRGDLNFSPAYEYGYKYGGLLILGFCEYVHSIAAEKKADKILFFSRDGYIVKQVYDKLYKGENTVYVCWSRNAAAKLGAGLFKDNFIKRFITQKINHNISLYDIMNSIGIADWEFPFSLNDELTMKNANAAERFILDNWDKLMDSYSDMDKAAKIYFSEILEGCKNVVTVDCGWAGSGNIFLEQIVNKKWGIECGFTGVLAGSNSYNQYDSDFSETFLLDKKLQVYCFSSAINRDKYMAHMPSANHNIYFELLFSAPQPSFREFALNGDGYELIFDDEAENEMYIREIQKGETDFINEYVRNFDKYPYMRNISGSDAYSPFMDAMKHSKKYIDKVFSECMFDETTNGKKVRIK